MPEEEDLPQDVNDLQKDIIIDLLGKAKRRLKRSVWDNLKPVFHYERGERLNPENPEDREKLEKIMSADYFVKKEIRRLVERINHYGIGDVRQLYENFQEHKVSRALEDAKHVGRYVKKSPVVVGAKEISSVVGSKISKYTTKLASYDADWLITKLSGYNEERLRQLSEATSDVAEFLKKAPREIHRDLAALKKVPGELNKNLKKATDELDRDFKAAFHYTKGKRLDSKNPEDLKILEETGPANYTWPKYVYDHSHYNEKNWFNENFGLMENGDLMSGKTRADVDALHDNFNKTKKSAAYEALKNFKIRNYGWSDLGRNLYDGVGKIGDGILYFPRRYFENERRQNREWEETYCGFTPRMNDYMKTKRLEREALKEAIKKRAQAQAGMATQFIPVGTGTSSPVVYMFNYQPQILAVDPSLFNRNQGQTN